MLFSCLDSSIQVVGSLAIHPEVGDDVTEFALHLPKRKYEFYLFTMYPCSVLTAIYSNLAQYRSLLHSREDGRDTLPINVITKLHQ